LRWQIDQEEKRLREDLDQSPAAKSVAGFGAGAVGGVVGLGRGAVNNAEHLADTLEFVSHLGFFGHPVDSSGVRQVFDIEKGLLGTAKEAALHPRTAIRRGAAALGNAQAKINPWATPSAPTLSGEMRRNYEVGVNRGQLGLGIAASLYGGPKTASALSRPPPLRGIPRYLSQGFSREGAEYLAEADPGMGHHNFRRSRADRLGIPKKVQDSPFNVLKPWGIDRGGMKELHFKVDRHFGGGRAPPHRGGEKWSGKELGIERYDPIERIWHATPPALKAALGGPIGLSLFMYEADKKKRANEAAARR
jgi:hypothetical protein